MLLLLHPLERCQRRRPATAAAGPPGQQRGKPLVTIPAWDAGVDVTKDRRRRVVLLTRIGGTAWWTLSELACRFGIAHTPRRVRDDDEHGCTTLSRPGRRHAARSSHGHGTSSEPRRPRRRTRTGCCHGAADASRRLRPRRPASQPSRSDDGEYTLGCRRSRTGRARRRGTERACPLTSQPPTAVSATADRPSK